MKRPSLVPWREPSDLTFVNCTVLFAFVLMRTRTGWTETDNLRAPMQADFRSTLDQPSALNTKHQQVHMHTSEQDTMLLLLLEMPLTHWKGMSAGLPQQLQQRPQH